MKKGISLLILGLFVWIGAYGDTNYKYIYSWDTDIYFGHVIYPEAKHDGKDAVVLREGMGSPEVADVNLPLGPGDTIRTNERRCEIQFDTGTVIRLDRNTELKIETILAQSLSSKNQLTNLLLLKGQAYVMYKRYVRKEIFQIITPNTAVKLNHHAVALIETKADGSTDILLNEGKGYALYGPNENAIKREVIKESKNIMVTPDHRVVAGQFEEIEDFEAWNEKLNREFLDLHEGKAALPAPIQRLSKAVYYFAQKYGSLYGEWLWDRYCGYVWRPFLNDRAYPGGGSWMPYLQGRWTSVQGQLFWVPYERWGWVPYHLGIWMWSKTKGWLWIPGSVFAPAWVDWSFYGGYFCWRPWAITDWYGYSVYGDGYFPYVANLFRPGDEQGFPSELPGSGTPKARRVITKDQLKKKASPLPMPKEHKETYKRVVIALKNGEDGILAPLKETPNHMLAVSQKDLNAPRIHEKVVKLTSLAKDHGVDFLSQKSDSRQPAHLQARQTYNRNEKIATLRDKVTDMIQNLKGLKDLEIQKFQVSEVIADNKAGDSQEKVRAIQPPKIQVDTSRQKQLGPPQPISRENVSRRSGDRNSRTLRAGRSAARFRDWNPDISVALRAGISIRYSSRSNEVRCPELNISSRHVSGTRGYEGPRVHLTSRGSVTASGGGGGVSAGGTASGSSSSSRGGSSSSSASGSGSKGASSGGKVVKN
jgi:hypothetical protein